MMRGFAAMGVRVINSRLSFLHLIPRRRRRMERTTGICKLDIPVAAQEIVAELAGRGLDTKRVLMTDADVLFADDFTYARWPRAQRLPTFAAGIEFFSNSLNSGVVYFNVSTMVAERTRMLQYAVSKGFKFLVADQSLLQEWFDPALGKGRRAVLTSWHRLDESIFNARPFVHPWRGHPLRRRPLPWHEVRSRPKASSVGRPSQYMREILPASNRAMLQPHIWHWHGYKPADVACWLRSIATGTWPLRAWRDTPGCARGGSARRAGAKEGGQCMYQPIKESGCRYLGRIRHSRCYLRTYTYLYTQHKRLLRLAQNATTGDQLWRPEV